MQKMSDPFSNMTVTTNFGDRHERARGVHRRGDDPVQPLLILVGVLLIGGLLALGRKLLLGLFFLLGAGLLLVVALSTGAGLIVVVRNLFSAG